MMLGRMETSDEEKTPKSNKAGTLLGCTETRAYVCLRFPTDPNPGWFTLCKQTEGYRLAAVQIPHSTHPTNFANLAVVGSDIYNIGGSFNQPSSSVSILDCQSHTWREGPSLPDEIRLVSASVLDGKIYVAAYLKNDDEDFFGVLDTVTQTWDHLPSPYDTADSYSKSACVDGKFYVMCGREDAMAYDPKECRWDLVGERSKGEGGYNSDDFANASIGERWRYSSSHCVVDNVMYCYTVKYGIQWYDTKARTWRWVKGVGRQSNFSRRAFVRLANYGGKLAIFGDQYVDYTKKVIRCAIATLIRPTAHEIRGDIEEWFDDLLIVPAGYSFVKVLSVTV